MWRPFPLVSRDGDQKEAGKKANLHMSPQLLLNVLTASSDATHRYCFYALAASISM